MAWTGDTFTSLLKLTELHAVYTDLTAMMAQQSGSPPPAGAWSGFSSVNIKATSGQASLLIGNQSAREMIQSVYSQSYNTLTTCAAAYANAMEVLITPKFGDSLIIVDAEINGDVNFTGTAAGDYLLANLARRVGGSLTVLTNCSATTPSTDAFGHQGAVGLTDNFSGTIRFTYQETSPGSGTGFNYGIQYALQNANQSRGLIQAVRIRVQEWR